MAAFEPTAKALLSPTTREFTAVAHFFMRQVEPGVTAFGRVEDDVPALFRRLRYPFPLSRAALFAVGAPTSWPGLLAALAWLADLLTYQELVEREWFESPPADGAPAAAAAREFFDHVAARYAAFMVGDDAGGEALAAAKVAERLAAAREVEEPLCAPHAATRVNRHRLPPRRTRFERPAPSQRPTPKNTAKAHPCAPPPAAAPGAPGRRAKRRRTA